MQGGGRFQVSVVPLLEQRIAKHTLKCAQNIKKQVPFSLCSPQKVPLFTMFSVCILPLITAFFFFFFFFSSSSSFIKFEKTYPFSH